MNQEIEVGITAPNCPRCGQFMDKVIVVVTDQTEKGTVPISKDINDTYIGWVCPNPKCHKPDK